MKGWDIAACILALGVLVATVAGAAAADPDGMTSITFAVPRPAPPVPSLVWTDTDDLPPTLQDSFSFGDMGPPDLAIRTDAGYQNLLDQAAWDSAGSARSESDDYVFVSHDAD